MAAVNWQSLVRDLRDRGWTQQQIAARVGCVQPLISKLNRGLVKSLGYEFGHAIVTLHASGERPARGA